MANILYIEPFSGVAGDMLLSALCGLADAYDDIVDLPDRLHLPDGRIEVQTLSKNGIVCRHVNILDTAISGASEAPAERARAPHHHDHPHENDHHHHHADHGPHRRLSDILALIAAAHISEGAKRIARSIFTIIGESESRIHATPIEQIHFHEVSGVDSILDIVGCAVLIDRLQITECYCDSICVGYGQVRTQHGLLPVPAPATADILRGMPTHKGDEAGERTTPTGAAILKHLNPRFEPPPSPASKIAYGPGRKDFRAANVARLSLLEPMAKPGGSGGGSVFVIETNLDDQSPELLGEDFQKGLLAAGALDFYFAPIQMKKGRPALLLSALAPDSQRDAVADFILENTSSLGVRYFRAERRILERREISVDTPYGTLLAKESIKPSGARHRKFEHESLKQCARQQNLSVIELLRRLPPA